MLESEIWERRELQWKARASLVLVTEKGGSAFNLQSILHNVLLATHEALILTTLFAAAVCARQPHVVILCVHPNFVTHIPDPDRRQHSREKKGCESRQYKLRI